MGVKKPHHTKAHTKLDFVRAKRGDGLACASARSHCRPGEPSILLFWSGGGGDSCLFHDPLCMWACVIHNLAVVSVPQAFLPPPTKPPPPLPDLTDVLVSTCPNTPDGTKWSGWFCHASACFLLTVDLVRRLLPDGGRVSSLLQRHDVQERRLCKLQQPERVSSRQLHPRLFSKKEKKRKNKKGNEEEAKLILPFVSQSQKLIDFCPDGAQDYEIVRNYYFFSFFLF